jgi:hypothetical protein
MFEAKENLEGELCKVEGMSFREFGDVMAIFVLVCRPSSS